MIQVSHGLCTLALRDDSGILRYGVDWLGSPSAPGGGDPAESVQPWGFRSKPRDPTLDAAGNLVGSQACGLLLLDDGGETFAWPTQDPRYRLVLPDVPQGSSELYAGHADGTATRVTVQGDDGVVVITTKTGATVKVLADGTLEVGGGSAVALAKAELVQDVVEWLLETIRTGSNGGGPVAFTTPGGNILGIPSLPLNPLAIAEIPATAATKAKSV